MGGSVMIFFKLEKKLSERLTKGSILPSLELYSQGIALGVGRRVPLTAIREELLRRGYTPERDYALGEIEACALEGGPTIHEDAIRCLWVKHPEAGPLMLTWDTNDWIKEIWTGNPWIEVQHHGLFPRLITQFSDGQPLQQRSTVLSETPLACLQAVTAIEDRDFLQHSGISTSGILRALIRNIQAGRFAEGGSTITQQLVKVYLLNSKKTISRKLEEQMLALIMETQLTKDQILEMYLNVIYMGQNGPYQVRGLASAADYYFDKALNTLSLPECALLAAIINNPGKFSPFNNPDQAMARRDLVLRKMHEANMFTAREIEPAGRSPIPKAPKAGRQAHAPYFVMSALREFDEMGLDSDEGIRLFTTLDTRLQSALIEAIAKQMPLIEARIKKPSKEPLQVAAVSVDLNSGQVVALSGGRGFRSTQFNRARDGRRQIGSIVKPFVFLPAMHEHDPMSEIVDAPFEWKTGRQKWRPKNYDGKSHGTIPYFYALAASLNVPTAKIAQEIGLNQVTETLREAGVKGKIPNVPSLSLGVLELPPLEVAQLYTTLARMGSGESIHSLARIENLASETLYARHPSKEFTLDPVLAARVVGMLEQTLNMGTAIGARRMGLTGVYAGKTGTTSDTKDAWFVGFNSHLLTVVWVGYDDNTPMGLTGGGAALPIWTDFHKAVADLYAPTPFAYPEGVERRIQSRGDLLSRFPDLNTVDNVPEEFELVF